MHPDAIMDLLRTHSAADPAQLQEICRSAKYYESEFASWQKRLDAALILVSSLQTKVDDLERKKDLFKSYTSPIHLLPTELLSRIFADASAEDTSFELFPSGRRDEPLASHALVHVCRFWRDVAIQTPGVWRHPVVLKAHEAHDGATVNRRLQQVLELYGRNLTRFYLHLPRYDWPGFNQIRDTTLQKQDQLKAMMLIGDMFGGSLLVHEVSAPLLEKLILCADSDQYESNTFVTFNAPSLTKLSIYYPASSLPFLSMPWQQITSLSLGFPSFTTGTMPWFPLNIVLDFLQHLASLVYLHLTGINIDYPIIQDISRLRVVRLPNLRGLEFHDGDCRIASVVAPQGAHLAIHPWISLLTHLSTPMLKQFDWIISATFHMPFLYSVQSINHFLRNASHLSSIRVAICDFHDAPVGLRSCIIRLTGTKSDLDFSPRSGNMEWFSDQNMLKFAEQTNRPPCISPRVVLDKGFIPSVDHYINHHLEDVEEVGAYQPVTGDLDRTALEDQARYLRLSETHRASTAILTGLFGTEAGLGDCEKRLYIVV